MKGSTRSRVRSGGLLGPGSLIIGEQVEADGKNMDNLLFPQAHLEVHKAMWFESVAQGDQFLHHVGEGLRRKHVGWLSRRS